MKCDVLGNVIPTPNIRLFHSPRKMERYLKKFGVEFEPSKFAHAETWTLDNGVEAYAVVFFGEDTSRSFVDDMALLAHEATHIALFTFDCIGETDPAEEEMCYMVQCITAELVDKHFKWKQRKMDEEHDQSS